MKASGQSAPSPNRPGRSWRVPPALTNDPGDVLEGAGVLRDFGGAPVALVLWQAAREVMLWSQSSVRADLFSPSAHGKRLAVLREANVPEDVAPLLRALSETVLGEPASAEAPYVAVLCRQVCDWAMEAGAGETALWYAQAAAMAFPAHARTALLTGTTALRVGKLDRAESWLLRAVGVARKRDLNAYGQAYIALARISEQRGDRARARDRWLLAIRAGRRGAIMDVRGKALHGLMRLSLDEGDLTEAARFARLARKFIGCADHPDRLTLAADFAAVLVRSGASGRARALLRDLLPRAAAEPGIRMYLVALQALALAQEEERSGALADVWTAAWGLAGENEGTDLAVRTFLTLAAAARKCGNFASSRRAEEAARRSIRTGLDRWLVERYAAEQAGPMGTGHGA